MLLLSSPLDFVKRFIAIAKESTMMGGSFALVMRSLGTEVSFGSEMLKEYRKVESKIQSRTISFYFRFHLFYKCILCGYLRPILDRIKY